MGHTHIHACAHTYTHAHACTRTHTCTYTHSIHTYIHMRTCTNTHTILHSMYYHVLGYKIAEVMLSIGIKYLKYVPLKIIKLAKTGRLVVQFSIPVQRIVTAVSLSKNVSLEPHQKR